MLSAALQLPDEDRLGLVEVPIASFEPSDQPPFDDSWREVIQRRSAEFTSGRVTSVPWSEVKRRD